MLFQSLNTENYGRFVREVVSPEVLPAGEVVVVGRMLLDLSLSVNDPLLAAGVPVVDGRLVVEPFVAAPVLLTPGMLLALVVGLVFVVFVELPPPPALVVEALRFIILPFEFAFPVSELHLAPTNAIVKSADNVNIFFIL